jgi:hypothetical protein
MDKNSPGAVTCSKCGLTFVPSFNFDFYPDGSDDPNSGWCETCMMKQAFPAPAQKAAHPIPRDYERDICKASRGKDTCAFLSISNGWKCLKGSSMEETILEKMQEGSMSAQADNCSGPPDFKAY